MTFQVDPVSTTIAGEAFKYGLPGLMLIIFLYALVYLLREHRAEREEWRKTFELHSGGITAAVNSVGIAVSELKGVVNTICTMIRDRD